MNTSIISSEEVESIRAKTLGTQHQIHFNNAGASLMPDVVRDVMIDYLQRESRWGGYETAAALSDQLGHVYSAIARLIGAEVEEIAVMENATAAWHMAFHSLRFQPGDEVLTSKASYASNYLSFLQAQKRYGISIVVASSQEDGAVDVGKMAELVSPKTRLIALTHIPTNGGLINPAAAVGKLARHHEIPFLLDACQSVGQLDIDVKEIGCDFLSATGRKYLRGPRGTGFLYVRREILDTIEPPFIDLHSATWTGPESYEWRSDARRFESWEGNLAGQAGLARAIDYALEIGMDRIEARIKLLAGSFRKKLASIPGVTIWDLGSEQSGIVSLTQSGIHAQALRDALHAAKINTSVLFPAATLLDSVDRSLPYMLRASIHYYNTEDELDTFCEHLEAL